MLSENVELPFILKILGIKILIGMICGFIIDLVYRKKEKEHIVDMCESEHCDCEHGIIKSSLKHTFNIIIFIAIISLIINIIMYYFGEEALGKLFMKDSIFGPFISSLVGLIPNCGASVALTELYLNEAINLGSLIGGLLTGAGVGLLILFKTNKNIKENINIVLTLYVIGVIFGTLINIIL